MAQSLMGSWDQRNNPDLCGVTRPTGYELGRVIVLHFTWPGGHMGSELKTEDREAVLEKDFLGPC